MIFNLLNTIDGFNAGIAHLMADTDLRPRTEARSSTTRRKTRTPTLKCHDANGELYFVNFTRDQVTVTSYSDDVILAQVDTWADTVPALA